MSNQPIKPETPSPVPSPPTSGPRCQYTLADFNIELWNLHDLDRQAKFHPLPPFSNFPGTGGEKSPVGEGPKGETGPKQPKSRPEDVETLDYLLDIKESVRVIAREHVQQGFQISDILRAIESTHKRMDEYEQKQLYLEKKTVNPLHDLKLGQQTILAKLKALPEPFNDSDAYYVPEPVPQHPFRQVEGGSSVKGMNSTRSTSWLGLTQVADFSHLNTAAPNGSDEGEIVPVEMGRPRPTPGLPTIPTPRPKPDHEPKRRPVPQPWVQ